MVFLFIHCCPSKCVGKIPSAAAPHRMISAPINFPPFVPGALQVAYRSLHSLLKGISKRLEHWCPNCELCCFDTWVLQQTFFSWSSRWNEYLFPTWNLAWFQRHSDSITRLVRFMQMASILMPALVMAAKVTEWHSLLVAFNSLHSWDAGPMHLLPILSFLANSIGYVMSALSGYMCYYISTQPIVIWPLSSFRRNGLGYLQDPVVPSNSAGPYRPCLSGLNLSLMMIWCLASLRYECLKCGQWLLDLLPSECGSRQCYDHHWVVLWHCILPLWLVSPFCC